MSSDVVRLQTLSMPAIVMGVFPTKYVTLPWPFLSYGVGGWIASVVFTNS